MRRPSVRCAIAMAAFCALGVQGWPAVTGMAPLPSSADARDAFPAADAWRWLERLPDGSSGGEGTAWQGGRGNNNGNGNAGNNNGNRNDGNNQGNAGSGNGHGNGWRAR